VALRPTQIAASPPPPNASSGSAFERLHRYFFYGWLFCDAGRGSVWERAAAWRHNRAQARWLPTYIRRWLVIGAGLFAAAWFVERMLLCPALSTFFYVPSALSVPFNAFTALCWTCLVHDRSL